MAGPSLMVRLLADVTGLSKSMDDAGSKGTSAAGKLHSAFRGTLDMLNQSGVLGPFGTALAGADAAIETISGHGKEIGPMMMGAGAAVAGVGMALQAAGSKEQASHQQLQAAVEATGHSYDQYASRVEDAIKTNEHFGTEADKTQDALRTLTTATGNPAKALDLLSTATDLAAAKHEDLNTAAGQLGKVYNGNTKLLKQFGIDTKDASGHVRDQSVIMGELSDKLKGQASAAANTFTGHLNAMKAVVMDHIAMFGQKYGPAITLAGTAMTGFGAAMQVATALTSSHTVATIAHTVATGLATAAQWALNLAMSANPIVLVVVLLAALVAAVILAYQHITIFRQIIDEAGRIAAAAFGVIVNAAQAVWNWIAAHWPLVLGILTGPFGLAVALIAMYWNQIVAFAAAIPGRILGALGALGGLLAGAGRDLINGLLSGAEAAWGAVGGWIGGIGGRIAGAIGNLGNLLYNAGKSIIEGLGRGITDALGGVLSTVSGIAGKIASLKGPLDVDRQLLVPAGTAIMAGLHESLAAGMSDVERLMGNVTATIGATGGGPAPVAVASSGPAVVVQNAHFSSDVDVEGFMRRAAWVARTAGL